MRILIDYHAVNLSKVPAPSGSSVFLHTNVAFSIIKRPGKNVCQSFAEYIKQCLIETRPNRGLLSFGGDST